MKIQQVKRRQANYPKLLAEIPSPPADFFYLGKLPQDEPCVAIVGSRKFTRYGQSVTQRLAYDLASMGITIISGLALGIDSIAHQAALEAGGKTIAVLACGLDQIYPASNRNLAKNILKDGGGIVSEYPVGTEPYKSNFPA